jgi:2-polyprenyl-3-methyl-5-hydroxy-6-metoxy-1,4-benzoquinol methylase
MTESIKFDPKKLAKLNNPERLKSINPDLIWQTLNMDNPQVLVDIGAGTGLFAKAFAKIANKAKIYACDTSEVMIEWMNENLSCPNIIPTKSDENLNRLNS